MKCRILCVMTSEGVVRLCGVFDARSCFGAVSDEFYNGTIKETPTPEFSKSIYILQRTGNRSTVFHFTEPLPTKTILLIA